MIYSETVQMYRHREIFCKRRNFMRQRPWREDDLKRMLINPFSSFLVASALVEEHELLVSTNEWISANKTLMESLGAEVWLRQVVSALEGKEVPDARVNPYRAINIDPCFAEEHDFIIPRDEWLRANAKLISQIGVEEWLSTFLAILAGDVPSSVDLGVAPSPAGDAPFGYRAVDPYPQQRYSFRQGGKRENKRRRRK
jgi:hypothetical protein